MPSEKILIVDDEEGMRKMLARVLIKHGYDAVIAGSGESTGLFYGGGFGQLGTQFVGVIACFAWAFGLGLVLFLVIKATVGLRVTPEEEVKGLVITEHGMEAYGGFQIFSTM